MRITPYYIICAMLCLLLSLNAKAQDTQSVHSESPKREMRAVWITTLSGLDWPRTKAINASTRESQKAELCQILDQLKAANINTILLQTRIRGSVIYPSAIEPWDIALTGKYDQNPGYDPLQFAIEEAHKRGMELHAWVVTIPCFKIQQAKAMGSRSVLRTHHTLCLRHAEQYYLDPGQPGTEDYLSDICREIVTNYDIDGLHFDYIRYPEQAPSFPDAATYKRYGSGQTKAAWRRNNITHIVRRIYSETKTIKPWVRVSSSPVGKYADLSRFSSKGWNARDAVHQDAEGWLREGIHDQLYPMMYFDGVHFYPFAADWAEQRSGRQVFPGLGIYFLHKAEKNWPLSVITRQLHYLRRQGLDGQCYFRSRFLTDNTKGIYDYLQNDFYAYPSLTPACTWLDSVPPTAPSNLRVESFTNNDALLCWQASDDNLAGGVRYNVYASNEWPVDITKAENLMVTCMTQTEFRFNRVFTNLAGLNFAVTSIDRCGNESAPAQIGHASTVTATGLLVNDGSTLLLPHTEGQFLLITDATGRTLRRLRPAERVDIRHLPAGLYRVYITASNKKKVRKGLVGEFIKAVY